jgi:hypothetical protein
MLKYYHEIGIYDEVVRGAEEATEDDLYEFSELGLELAAPEFEQEEIPLGYDCEPVPEEDDEPDYEHFHMAYRFTSPAMREYYRLCRLYELQQSLPPEKNPFVQKADAYCCGCASCVRGYLWIGFNDDRYTSALAVEICPDEFYDIFDLTVAIHGMIEYYEERVRDVGLALAKGRPVYLPALPAPKGVSDGEAESAR